jgi:DNA-binding IclR family transcriptional regulator
VAAADADGLAGIQSIERAVLVLRSVASLKRTGARLTDVMESTGLSKTTTHRMLQALTSTGLLDQEPSSGMFHLGMDFVALALTAANRYDLVDLVSPAMSRLAERTGDTIYFNLRDRYCAICVERVEGAFPIKTLTLDRGDRRPLGVGAGNLAMLAFLGDAEVRTALEVNAAAIAGFGRLDAATLLELVAQTRQQGYALNEERIIPGMSAVGVPILGRDATPVAALSVAAVSERMRVERRSNIVAWLIAEARAVEEQLRKVLGPISEAGVRGLLRRRSGRS